MIQIQLCDVIDIGLLRSKGNAKSQHLYVLSDYLPFGIPVHRMIFAMGTPACTSALGAECMIGNTFFMVAVMKSAVLHFTSVWPPGCWRTQPEQVHVRK